MATDYEFAYLFSPIEVDATRAELQPGLRFANALLTGTASGIDPLSEKLQARVQAEADLFRQTIANREMGMRMWAEMVKGLASLDTRRLQNFTRQNALPEYHLQMADPLTPAWLYQHNSPKERQRIHRRLVGERFLARATFSLMRLARAVPSVERVLRRNEIISSHFSSAETIHLTKRWMASIPLTKQLYRHVRRSQQRQ